MIGQQMTKKELLKYFYLTLEIKSLEEKIKQIRNETISSYQLTGMPFANERVSPVEKKVELLDKLSSILEQRKNEALERQIDIETYISTIQDTAGRNILHKRYIELKSWNKIMREMYMSERSVFRKHKEMIENEKSK